MVLLPISLETEVAAVTAATKVMVAAREARKVTKVVRTAEAEAKVPTGNHTSKPYRVPHAVAQDLIQIAKGAKERGNVHETSKELR